MNVYSRVISTLSTTQYRIFLVRIIIAICVISFLGKANIWVDTTTNTIFAAGSRILLALTPLTILLFGKQSLLVTVAAMALGLMLFYCLLSWG